jgi:hypothetical protein
VPEASAPAPGAKCGDGICDDLEKKDPNLCPQDCTQPAAPSPVASTGSPDYEPPINIFLVLHIDPSMDQGGDSFKVEPGIYDRTYNEIEWLRGEAARHGLRFTALYNGWYPHWALREGDTSQFRALLEEGHEVGSHAHRLTYDSAQDIWISHVNEVNRYGRPNYDADLARQAWVDADRYVDQVMDGIGAKGENQTMCAVPFKCSDEGQMMTDLGFSIAAGNRSEKGPQYFGHIVWNPWRPAASDEPAMELKEDRGAGYIAVDHLAQIGSTGSHGMDLTVPQMQRRFLMLYAEWLARERSGAEDRVWTFGFCLHPNYSDRYNAELIEFLDWLDANFVHKDSPHGNTIARYATIADIGREYLAWEEAHPGASSFSWVREQAYPYTFEIVPTKLEGAAYEGTLDLDAGVTGYHFSRAGEPVYMLWSDGSARNVDLSGLLEGQIRVTDAFGRETVFDSAAVSVSVEPLLVEPLG